MEITKFLPTAIGHFYLVPFFVVTLISQIFYYIKPKMKLCQWGFCVLGTFPSGIPEPSKNCPEAVQ
jgi:hypothetical protein